MFKWWKKLSDWNSNESERSQMVVGWTSSVFLSSCRFLLFFFRLYRRLNVGPLQSFFARSFTLNDPPCTNSPGEEFTFWVLHLLLIAPELPPLSGGGFSVFLFFVFFSFGREPSKRLVSKMKRKKKKKRSIANLTFRSLETVQLHQKWTKKNEKLG